MANFISWSSLLIIVLIENVIILTFLIIQNTSNSGKYTSTSIHYHHEQQQHRNEIRERDHIIAHENDTKPTHLKQYYYLFIMITSRAESRNRRLAIRKTWLSKNRIYFNSEYPIGHMFVIGKYGLEAETLEELEEENRIYGDILALDYQIEDKYEYLSHKVLHAITWIGGNVNATYVMKTDEDVCIDLEALLIFLIDEPFYRLAVLRYIHEGAKPIPYGKWIKINWKVCSNYFPQPVGMGYVISRGVVDFIKNNHNYLKSYREKMCTLEIN